MVDFDIIKNDIPKCISLLKETQNGIDDISVYIQKLIDAVKGGEISTAKGISFLEVKNHMLLTYLMELSWLYHMKLSGQSIEGFSGVERLVELRTILERIRPIEKKLKYQIDKLIKVAATGSEDREKDPLRYKANPDNLVSKFDEEESESESEEESGGKKSDKQKLYVPPKITAMHYDGDETVQDREQKKLEKAKKRALSSSLLQELRQEYHDGPEEIADTADIHRMKANKRANERTKYEEDMFMRLPVSKKEKNSMKRLSTVSSLEGLVQFENIQALTNEGGFNEQMVFKYSPADSCRRGLKTHGSGSLKKRKLSKLSKGKGKKGKKKGFKKKKH